MTTRSPRRSASSSARRNRRRGCGYTRGSKTLPPSKRSERQEDTLGRKQGIMSRRLNIRISRLSLATILGVLAFIPSFGRAQTPQVTTYAQVQAVFSKHCVSCHNAEDEDGELILESHASLMKGGESGAVVVPGKADESLLVKLIRHEQKPFMPPPKKGMKL